MKRSEVINNLKGLAALSDLARSYYTGNVGEWVGLGLLTESEYDEYCLGAAAEHQVYKAGRDAEDAIPFVDLEADPRLPKAYRAIVERMAELKPLVDADKAVNSILRNMGSLSPHGNRTIGEQWGLADLAQRAQVAINKAEDDFRGDYYSLGKEKEPKERQGTIVNRIRIENYDKGEAARKKARAEAMEAAAARNPRSIRRKKELDRLVEKRRDEKIKPIREAMKKVLEDALKGAK